MSQKGNGLIRTIQVARRQLGLSEEAYRATLEAVTGKSSLREMSAGQLWRVVEHFKAKGFVIKLNGKPVAGDKQNGQLRKVRHLWLVLKNYGVLRNASEEALRKYAARICKVDRLEWLTPPDLQYLIEVMKKWVARIENKICDEAVSSGELQPDAGFNFITSDAKQEYLARHYPENANREAV